MREKGDVCLNLLLKLFGNFESFQFCNLFSFFAY